MSTTVWDFDRRTGIGASTAPAICGFSPWSSPLGEYLWFTGQLPDRFQSDQMSLGLEIEECLRRLAEKRLGEQITRPVTLRHAELTWMYASPDGVCASGAGFDSKNVGMRHVHEWGKDGTDEIPDYVLIQAQHQAYVFGFQTVHIGALLAGTNFRMYPVERNDRVIDRMLEMELAFWERVQKRQPPEPDWSDARTPALVQAMHPLTGGEVYLGDDADDLVGQYVEMGGAVKVIDQRRDEVKARLIEMMAGAETAHLPSGVQIKRRLVERAAYNVKATEYYDFRVKQPKAQKARFR